MSVSQHPIALRLEEAVEGRDTALLATVMLLPLIDGIFPALLLTGALDTAAGVVMVGLLIFSGSATVAVVLAEFDGSTRECARTVLLIGIPLIVLAGIEAALAPVFESVLDLVIFERFAALVILAVAASTASARIGTYLPRPAVIIALGVLASIDPANAELALLTDPELVARGVAAATIGVAATLVVALAAPTLRQWVDIDRFRFGSAVALGLLPLSILGLPFGEFVPLGALALTALFAIDPDAESPAQESQEVNDPPEPDRAPWL